MNDCVFCKIIARQIPADIIAETDDVIVIKDINPKAPIHYLILPKKHIKDLQSFEKQDCCYASKMLLMARDLSHANPQAAQFRLIMNNGHAAGQRVFHSHIHFLAGATYTE